MNKIDLEGYARILVHLACRRNESIEAILDDLDVDADALREAEPGIRRDLADAWAQRKGIGAMRFAASLGKELQLLGTTLLAKTQAEPPELLGEPSVAVPSYLRDTPAPNAPFALPAAVSEMLASYNEVAKPSPAATMDADLSAIVSAIGRGALPFTPSADAQNAGTPSRIAGSPSNHELPASPSREPLKQNPSGTMEADLSAIMASIGRSGALPFARDGAPPSAGAPVATMALPASQGPEAPDLSALPLEVYASVTGALARGQSREEALAKHHLSAEDFDKLAKAWAPRFAQEPHLLARFKELAKISAAGRRGDP